MAYDESKLINLGHLKDALEVVKEHIPEDTDIKVTQTLVSDNVERPILTAPTAQSATTTTTSAFSTNVKVNASTGNLIATKFTGDGTGLNVGSTSGNAVYTTTDGKLMSGSLATSDPSASGNTASFIDSISQDSKGQITATKKTVVPPTIGFGYGTCATDAATVAKTATLTGYELVAGGIVSIKFTYAVPASATLSINSQTAKAIQYNGSAITAGIIQAGDLVTFIYDGSYYHVIGILQENKIIFSSASLTLATSRWSSSGDTTYPYKAVINMPGVTENFLPVVQFRDSDTLLYDFSPIATSGAGTITIMCKTAPTTAVVIPQIICYRGQGVTLS